MQKAAARRERWVGAQRNDAARNDPRVIDWAEIDIQTMIGDGAMGRLYCVGWEPGTDRPERMCLRRLHEEHIQMQTREELIDAYTSLQELQHPNILEILGFATDGLHHDGVLMPLMPLTLEKMLTRGAQRSEAFGHKLRALFPTMIKETVLGLEYLREMHYRMWAVHPRNILLDQNLQVKLTDYGRSRGMVQVLLDQHDVNDDQAATKEPTEFYYAPELLNSQRAGAAADVWSLGCLITRMATMEPLYTKSLATSHMTYKKILHLVADGTINATSHITTESSVPPSFMKLARECMKMTPAARPKLALIVERIGDHIEVHADLRKSHAAHLVKSKTGLGMPMPKPGQLPSPASMPRPAQFPSPKDVLALAKSGRLGNGTSTMQDPLAMALERRSVGDALQGEPPRYLPDHRTSARMSSTLPLAKSLARRSVIAEMGEDVSDYINELREKAHSPSGVIDNKADTEITLADDDSSHSLESVPRLASMPEREVDHAGVALRSSGSSETTESPFAQALRRSSVSAELQERPSAIEEPSVQRISGLEDWMEERRSSFRKRLASSSKAQMSPPSNNLWTSRDRKFQTGLPAGSRQTTTGMGIIRNAPGNKNVLTSRQQKAGNGRIRI